jgi:hypothetical protein
VRSPVRSDSKFWQVSASSESVGTFPATTSPPFLFGSISFFLLQLCTYFTHWDLHQPSALGWSCTWEPTINRGLVFPSNGGFPVRLNKSSKSCHWFPAVPPHSHQYSHATQGPCHHCPDPSAHFHHGPDAQRLMIQPPQAASPFHSDISLRPR